MAAVKKTATRGAKAATKTVENVVSEAKKNSKTTVKKELTKDDLINAEIKKLNMLFKDVDKKPLKATNSLIENAAFMIVTLRGLQEDINKNGVISEYQNGENQWGTKKSPEVEIYNSMIRNFAAVMKQLQDLLPKDAPKAEEDEFAKFIENRK